MYCGATLGRFCLFVFQWKGEELHQTRQLSTFDSLKWKERPECLGAHQVCCSTVSFNAGNLNTSGSECFRLRNSCWESLSQVCGPTIPESLLRIHGCVSCGVVTPSQLQEKMKGHGTLASNLNNGGGLDVFFGEGLDGGGGRCSTFLNVRELCKKDQSARIAINDSDSFLSPKQCGGSQRPSDTSIPPFFLFHLS